MSEATKEVIAAAAVVLDVAGEKSGGGSRPAGGAIVALASTPEGSVGHMSRAGSQRIVEGFVERQQQLSVLVNSSLGVNGAVASGLVPASHLEDFALELRDYHKATPQALARQLGADCADGLAAGAAAVRLKEVGPNVVRPPAARPLWMQLLSTLFLAGFAPLLWFATLFVFLSWQPFGAPPSNVYSLVLAITLVIVNCISGLLTFWQEQSSSSALASFKSMVPTKCLVVRGGIVTLVPAAELVPGDLVELQAGSTVPADMRVVKAHNLRANTAMLTGESEPVRVSEAVYPAESKVSLLEAKNVLFQGTSIMEGSGKGIVFATGGNNQLAKIVTAAAATKAAGTHLQAEINKFVTVIAGLAVATGVIVVAVWAAWLRVDHPLFMSVSTMIANAISVIVAFVPEGLPLALTIGLTIVARRLCLQHAVLVKTLGTIETLGSVSFICSDKTGTLTMNKMTVTCLIAAQGAAPADDDPALARSGDGTDAASVRGPLTGATTVSASDVSFAGISSPGSALNRALAVAVLCNAASVKGGDRDTGTPDPSRRSSTSSLGAAAGQTEEPAGITEARAGTPFDRAPGADLEVVGGNGIDKALLHWALSFNGAPAVAAVHAAYERVATVPFSSVTKVSVEVVRDVTDASGGYVVMMKGAPEAVLARCTRAYALAGTGSPAASRAVEQPLSGEVRAALMAALDKAASHGLRVVALAERRLDAGSFPLGFAFDADSQPPNFPADELTFASMVAVSDPPREGVRESVQGLRGAGIKVAMVTGDTAATAVAIARQVAIVTADAVHTPPSARPQSASSAGATVRMPAFKQLSSAAGAAAAAPPADTPGLQLPAAPEVVAVVAPAASEPARPTAAVVTGQQLRELDAAGWKWLLAHDELVFARTTPEQKLQIVNMLKGAGHRVGVTGDGVNDAPALRAADVGVAMNSGSDISRDVAAIVLLRDTFTSVLEGVREGRIILNNLRKVIAYQIAAGCWSELLPVLATFFLGIPQPLSSFLMIIISCVTDVCAGIALMHEPPEAEIMLEKPRNVRTDPLVSLRLIGYSYLFYGNLASLASFVLWFAYMSGRGLTGAVPDPLPADDAAYPASLFPVGYTPDQLVFAWNWQVPPGPLGADQASALATASSVFFVTLVMCQLGHLLSIRRKDSPYFADVRGDGTVLGWLRAAAASVQLRANVLMAWAAELAIVVIITEVPFLQSSCGTAHVPGSYWGWAALWSVAIFVVAEGRKWAIRAWPQGLVARLTAF